MTQETDPAATEAAIAAAEAGTAPDPDNIVLAEAGVQDEGATATNCEGCDDIFFDVVIPIVYPTYAIFVPYAEIKEELGAYDLAVDEEESVRLTFTRPDTDPPMSISGVTGTGVRVLGLGHAGVAIINGRTGATKYYEYGRYDQTPDGRARDISVANVTIGPDKNPTRASFEALLDDLTDTNGNGYPFEAAYIKRPHGAFAAMDAFAQGRIEETVENTAADYDISGNHCFTFAMEVAAAGGADGSTAGAEELQIIVALPFGFTRNEYRDIDVPARQIKVVQARETSLSVNGEGEIQGAFSFP